MAYVPDSYADRISGNPWQRAYIVTLALTGLSLALTLTLWGFNVESRVANGAAAAFMCGVGFYCALRLVRGGAILGALPYFMVGSAVFYGAGTVFAVLNPAPMALMSFTEDAQRVILAKANLANSLGIFVVVLAAAPFCAFMRPEPNEQTGLRSVTEALGPYLVGLMMAAAVVMCLMWWTFPRSDNFILATLLRLLGTLPLFTILLGALMWRDLTGSGKFVILGLVLSFTIYGLITLTKVNTLLGPVVLILGWCLNGYMLRWGVGMLLVLVTFYFAFFAEFVGVGRLHVNYDPDLNTLSERANIVVDSVENYAALREVGREVNVELRFTMSPFQAYFMTLYDTGFPGDSMDHATTILIPRIFWPEKPEFSPGNEFDTIFRGSQSENSLAIGLFTEGYWNMGWLGILIVSSVVGVQLGWFTRKWFLFSRYGLWHAGIFAMAPAVVYQATWAEANFVGAYVGGTARMIILIVLIDFIVRGVISYKRAEARL